MESADVRNRLSTIHYRFYYLARVDERRLKKSPKPRTMTRTGIAATLSKVILPASLSFWRRSSFRSEEHTSELQSPC